MEPPEKRLAERLGFSSSSPEVPAEIISRDLEILGGGQVGYRVSKYGVQGLALLFKKAGEYAKSPQMEQWSPLIGRGVCAAISVAALFLLRGRTSRILAFGATWENLTAGCDWLEEQARKAIGV